LDDCDFCINRSGGLYWLEFAGAQHYSAGDVLDLGTRKVYAAAGCSMAAAAGQFILAKQRVAAVAGRYYMLGRGTDGNLKAFKTQGTTATTVEAAYADTSTAIRVIGGGATRAVQSLSVRVNGSEVANSGTVTADNTANQNGLPLLRIGCVENSGGAPDTFLTGDIYGIIQVMDTPSAAKFLAAERWCGAKCGVGI